MLEHTRKHPTKAYEARFYGTKEQIDKLKTVAVKIGVRDASELVSLEEIYPEVITNGPGVCLRGARAREGMSQRDLATATGIPQRHLSEMENGKRPIGKETARKLAGKLNADYRVFL